MRRPRPSRSIVLECGQWRRERRRKVSRCVQLWIYLLSRDDIDICETEWRIKTQDNICLVLWYAENTSDSRIYEDQDHVRRSVNEKENGESTPKTIYNIEFCLVVCGEYK